MFDSIVGGVTLRTHQALTPAQVAQLEADAQQLREAVQHRQGLVKTLERRVGSLEAETQELQIKVSMREANNTGA